MRLENHDTGEFPLHRVGQMRQCLNARQLLVNCVKIVFAALRRTATKILVNADYTIEHASSVVHQSQLGKLLQSKPLTQCMFLFFVFVAKRDSRQLETIAIGCRKRRPQIFAEQIVNSKIHTVSWVSCVDWHPVRVALGGRDIPGAHTPPGNAPRRSAATGVECRLLETGRINTYPRTGALRALSID